MRRRYIAVFGLLALSMMPVSHAASRFAALELKETKFCYQPAVVSGSASCLDLPRWDEAAGMAPARFSVKVTLKGYGNRTAVKTPIRIEYALKLGELTINPDTLLVDTAHLYRTARWYPWLRQEGTLPDVAPQETIDFVADPLPFDQVRDQTAVYPIALRATVILPRIKVRKVIELPISGQSFASKFLSRATSP